MSAMDRAAPPARPARPTPGLHLPSLAVALLIMLAGTLYPLLFADADGHADHRFATALCWAMSAGFVRGLGFVPQRRWARWLFSGWAVLAALGLALAQVLYKT